MPPRSTKKATQAAIAKFDCSASQASTKVPSQGESSSPNSVTIWLKEQLEEAWRQEIHLKKLIQTITDSKAAAIEAQADAVEKQTGHVREEVERWMMRNEEMEQHL